MIRNSFAFIAPLANVFREDLTSGAWKQFTGTTAVNSAKIKEKGPGEATNCDKLLTSCALFLVKDEKTS
jgi:hypothetical protein